jgi:hypothetical protein
MALDIIYPIILTPIAFAVGYGIHAFRKSMKQELPEAKPYEFERDEYNPDFDQFSQAISTTNSTKEKQNDNNNTIWIDIRPIGVQGVC